MRATLPTQKERVLRSLRAVGKRGITQVDFTRYPTVDGGPPITRVAARIEELKQDGHWIATRGWRDKCIVYTLVAEAAAAVSGAAGVASARAATKETAPTEVPALAAPETLFDPPPATPQNALNDDWVA